MTKKLLIAGIFMDLLTTGAVLYSAARRESDDYRKIYLVNPEETWEYYFKEREENKDDK